MNRAIIFFASALLAAGCAQVEKGTGKALGNANGVVNTYAPKVWGPGENAAQTGTPQSEAEIDPVTGKKKEVEHRGS